jgi:hypothetical protein
LNSDIHSSFKLHKNLSTRKWVHSFIHSNCINSSYILY